MDEALPIAIAELDSTFFRLRFERITPFERRYLRAMAELGHGPHRSGEIANAKGLSRPAGRTHTLEPGQQGDDLQPGPR